MRCCLFLINIQFCFQKNSLKGALGEMRNAITKLKRDLNQEKYRMARRNLKEKLCELAVTIERVIEIFRQKNFVDKTFSLEGSRTSYCKLKNICSSFG